MIIHRETVAKYWHATPEGNIQCDLCPHQCKLKNNSVGRCRVRTVRNNKLIAAGYGQVSSIAIDPIEKKPLYHFYPGDSIFSIGGWGCNLGCVFCQNWSISQQFIQGNDSYSPQNIVEMAIQAKQKTKQLSIRKLTDSPVIGIAYTYNEPIVGYEFVFDCAQLAKQSGLANVLVTNGYILPEPASQLLPLIDALNIDLKGITEHFYQKYCHASLEPVQNFIKQAISTGCHVELTNLIIPGLNDSDDEIHKLAHWISQNLGKYTPLHISAYRPEYKLNIPPTPVQTLERAFELCRNELAYVYVGNVITKEGQDTRCPECNALLIQRSGYNVKKIGITGKVCKNCGRKLDIVFDFSATS